MTRAPVMMGDKRDVASEIQQTTSAFDEAIANPADAGSQEYTKRREDLLDKETEDAWDRPAQSSMTNPHEKRASEIIATLRIFEREDIFGNMPSESVPGPETRDMGGQFLTNKSRIEGKSKMFEIARKVPKGALLHLHFNAELHPERLLEEARTMENMYVWSIQPLRTLDDLEATEMIFNVLDKDTPDNDIFSPDYKGCGNNWRQENMKPHVWMKWSTFRRDFEKQFPGKYEQKTSGTLRDENGDIPNSSEPGKVKDLTPAENWIRMKMVLSEEEAYGLRQTVNR